MLIKDIYRKLRFGHKATSADYVNYLRSLGMSIMKRVESDGQRGCILGASGNLTIGNNVFIGMNAIVLRGVTIGNDVIIGAGSVIAKDCESGWGYAGNPAKKIISIQDYFS